MSNSSQDLTALTFNQFFKALSIIHVAMFIGSFLMIIVTRIILGFDNFNFQEINYQYALLGLLAVISAIFIGKKLSGLMKNKITSSQPLESKLKIIQSSKIIEFAFTEIPIVICIMIGFVLNEFSLTIIAALTLIYFWSLKPVKPLVIENLHLTSNEQSYIQGNLTLKEWKKSVANQ